MKKVAVFVNQCLPLSEIFIYYQAKALKNYAPELVGCRSVTPSVNHDLPSFILNKTHSRAEKIEEARFKFTLHNKKLEEKIREHDLVHAHFGPTGWLASGLAVKTGKPLVVTCHGFDVLKRKISLRKDGLLQALYGWNRKRLGERAAKFICVSEYTKQRAIEFGFPAEKCVVHYMGIPLIEHTTVKHVRQNKKEPFRLLAVGRLVPFKAHAKLIEAVAKVEAAGHNVELNIIGDGPLRTSLEEQAAKSLKKFKFWGAQQHDKVLSLMRQSDVFCHTSMHMPNGQTEAFGLVVLEAQWAGLPVIAFASGGVPEALNDGTTGFLVPEGDTDAFADRICRLIDDEALFQQMAAAAPEFVRVNFDNRKQSIKLEEIYDSVL